MPQQEFSYLVVYENDDETGYVCASVPALDLASHGRTFDEARAMIREALEVHLEGMLEENMPIPPDVQASERITVQVQAPALDGAKV